MLGSLRSDEKKVTVIGGGIAGLLAAYVLDKKGYEVTLYESQSRLGGWVHTENTPWGITENAAHSLLATPLVQEFCKEIGVELLSVSPKSKARYVLRRGKMRRLPLSFFEIFGVFKRVLFNRWMSPRGIEDVSLAQWAQHLLGPAALQYLISPMVRGIYAASPSELSLQGAFPLLAIPEGKTLAEAKIFSRFSKKSSASPNAPSSSGRSSKMMTPLHGMGSLIHCLESRLRERLGDRLKTGTSLSELPQDGNVILTVPAATAADFLKTRSPELAGTLSQIPYVSLVSATVFLKKSGLKRVPRGVGVLVAPNEKLRILGVLFNSSSFENRVVHSAWVSCTVLLGGTQDPAIMSESDEKIRMIIRSELDSLFGFEGDPVLEISIKKQKNAIPLYNSDLCQFWKKAKETWCSVPGQVLFGNYTGKVSIRGMIETVSDDLKFPSFK